MKHSYVSGEYRVEFNWPVQIKRVTMRVSSLDPGTAVWLPITPELETSLDQHDPATLDRVGALVAREIRKAADETAKLPDMVELAKSLRSSDVRFTAGGPGGTSGATPGM